MDIWNEPLVSRDCSLLIMADWFLPIFMSIHWLSRSWGFLWAFSVLGRGFVPFSLHRIMGVGWLLRLRRLDGVQGTSVAQPLCAFSPRSCTLPCAPDPLREGLDCWDLGSFGLIKRRGRPGPPGGHLGEVCPSGPISLIGGLGTQCDRK